MSHTAKTPPVAKGSNDLPVNAVDGTQAYDTDKSQYVVSVSNAWQGVGGGGGFGTPTVVYDDGAAVGNTDQIQGDIPANWKTFDASLKGLVIGTSCTSIGSSAFYFCDGLTGDLVIPDSVTTIGDNAFDMLIVGSSLTGLTIGNGVTSIGSNAFYGLDSLPVAYINCPASSWTGTFALGNTNALTNIYVHADYVAGYNAAWKTAQSTTATVNTWTNYPNIP